MDRLAGRVPIIKVFSWRIVVMDMHVQGKRLATAAASVLALVTSPAVLGFQVGLVVNGGIESTNERGSVLPPGQHVQTYWQENLQGPTFTPLVDSRSQALLSLTGATAQSRADFGNLGVYTNTWVMPRIQDVYGAWVSNASARARFYDGWTISAPGQDVGAPATLTVGFQLDGWLTPSSDHFHSSICMGFSTFLSNGEHRLDVCPTSPGFYTLALPARLNVDFGVSMELTAWTTAYNEWESGSSTVDFYDSAIITGLTLVDGSGAAINRFSLTAESGHVYLPVPEPATSALWMTGLAAIGASLRRTRRH
jgi:hypothetical protein